MTPCRKEVAAAGAVAIALVAGNLEAQMNRYDALADSPMAENRPTPDTAKLLRDELLFQRATITNG